MEKQLRRSLNNRRIAGVCGGIAEYFSIDGTIVRLAFALLSLIYGGGIIVYLLAWFLIPEENGIQSAETIEYKVNDSYGKRKLYRSRRIRSVAGVCGGIAEYFGIDVTIVRLATILLTFMFGGGLIAYIIAALIIPEEPQIY